MFQNEVTWLFISMAVVLALAVICLSKIDIEKEHTKQLELQLKISQTFQASTSNIGNQLDLQLKLAQISQVSTNNIGK